MTDLDHFRAGWRAVSRVCRRRSGSRRPARWPTGWPWCWRPSSSARSTRAPPKPHGCRARRWRWRPWPADALTAVQQTNDLGRSVENKRFGVAPGVTEVLSARVLDRNASGRREAIVAGLQWISEHPRVDVICIAMGISFASNMSAHAQSAQANRQDLTQTLAKDLREYMQLLRTYQSFSAVAASLGKGAVLIMPAGNDSQPNARVPVTSPISVAQGVISVGAVQQGNSGYQVAFFSNSLPTVCAPGVEILSAHLGGKLRSLQGTSMSCANAAGIAALWWEYLRSRNPGREITSRMVAAEMLKAARTDVFTRDTQEIDRGAGLLQAPPR